jgi:hypothetical protein
MILRFAYSVYADCAEDCDRHLLSVFGILLAAHQAVVVVGEHAADGAEDYNGEDGNDDAVRIRLVLSIISDALVSLGLRTMSMH